eukprot:366521-Chlamydomonas_euryale.AAC.11
MRQAPVSGPPRFHAPHAVYSTAGITLLRSRDARGELFANAHLLVERVHRHPPRHGHLQAVDLDVPASSAKQTTWPRPAHQLSSTPPRTTDTTTSPPGPDAQAISSEKRRRSWGFGFWV